MSDRIVAALIETTKAQIKTDVLLNEYPTIRPLLSDTLWTLDTYYSFYDSQPDIFRICHSLYVPGQTSSAAQLINTIAASSEYAQNKAHITCVLAAGDLLKIDEAITTTNVAPLTANYHSCGQELRIEALWPILHDLYGPQRQYPLILETAIACYQFLAFSEDDRISLLSQAILFSTIYRNSLAFQGLHRQWLLSTDPQITLSSMDTEDALVHILYVFQQMWEYKTELIRKLNNKRDEIIQFIEATFSRQIPVEFHQLLAGNMCIRNQDVTEKLRLSAKTAIKYLKMLEQENALYSIKSGREVFYFNNMLLDLLQQATEVYNNGPEKP